MDGLEVPFEENPFGDAEADAAKAKAGQEEAEENAEIVRDAKEFYRVAMAASSTWRKEALTDLRFLAGDQWDDNHKGQREAQGRPALTVNRIPQFARQVTNEQRQSKPGITVNPVDSGADIRTAEVLQGAVRNIEYTSNASEAYAAGGESAAHTGLGYWEVACEFENERSFEQRIAIKRIKNPMSVCFDPGAREIAGDDAKKAILSKDITEGEFKSRWPTIDVPKGSEWTGEGNSAASWVGESGARIHEYRYVKSTPDTLIDLSRAPEEFMQLLVAAGVDVSGGAVLESDIQPDLAQMLLTEGAPSRPTTKRKACWAKIAGDEVLEKGEFAGEYLQLVRVVGGEIEIDGETIYEGVIRHARDPQKILNMMVSSEVEAIGLTPKAPFMATTRQIEGYEDIWQTANTKTHAYLPYNPDPTAPPPQRVMAEANVQAITNARMQAADDLKATTGIYDAALGARSNESSGKAILARESQAQTANFHFQDNLAAAIRYTGRILVDLIPKIYAGERILRILGEDGRPEMVPVNGMEDPSGKHTEPIQLNAGRYDVAVSMGPSYQSRRQEATAQLLELIRVNPAVSQVAGDLIVESMDIPGGKEIAKRLKALLPPEIKPPDEKQPPPQVLAMQLQQQGQLVEKLTQELNGMREEFEANAQDNAAKKELALIDQHTKVLMKLAEIDSAHAIALLKTEADAINQQRKASTAAPAAQPIEGGVNGY